MASGIKDKVAIVGMGCTAFGEHWSRGPEDLMVDAFEEALADAKIARGQIQAAWMGNALDDINVGNSALPLAHALRLKSIPVSRVENMCATGSEALRAAVYAVAAGAVDFALALGVEKLKDTGYGGLPLRTKGLANDLWLPYGSAPGSFAQLAGAYAARHGIGAGRSQTGDGACELEEPSERRAEPARASAQGGRHRDHPEGADDRRSARPVRLLRRFRRRGLRDRHDARHRARSRNRQPGHGQGGAA